MNAHTNLIIYFTKATNPGQNDTIIQYSGQNDTMVQYTSDTMIQYNTEEKVYEEIDYGTIVAESIQEGNLSLFFFFFPFFL